MITMRITKGDTTVNIPGWAVLIGALVVDNIVVNVCKTISYKKLCNTVETVKKEES